MELPANPFTTNETDKGRPFRVSGITNLDPNSFKSLKWRVSVRYLDTVTFGYFDFYNNIKVFQFERINQYQQKKLISFLFPENKKIEKNKGYFQYGDIKIFIPDHKENSIFTDEIKDLERNVVLAKFKNNKKLYQYEKL